MRIVDDELKALMKEYKLFYDKEISEKELKRRRNREIARKRIEEEQRRCREENLAFLSHSSESQRVKKQKPNLKKFEKYKKGKKRKNQQNSHFLNESVNRRYGIHNPKPDKKTVLSESRNFNRDYNIEYENTLFASNTSGTGRHKRKEWNSNVALSFSRYLRGSKKTKNRNSLDGVDRGALK